jgi:hypothetical protein
MLLDWVSFLAYPNLFGIKGFVVVVDMNILFLAFCFMTELISFLIELISFPTELPQVPKRRSICNCTCIA